MPNWKTESWNILLVGIIQLKSVGTTEDFLTLSNSVFAG